MKAPLPPNEAARLESLGNYYILDTPPDPDFDNIARLAANICKTPAAFINFVDEKRQWFKAHIGLDLSETHRDIAFCAHTILQSEVMVITDATKDRRFADNPLVTGPPYIRFYAGSPLISSDNYSIGTLSVVDYKPGRLNNDQLYALQVLGKQVITQLELRRHADAQIVSLQESFNALICSLGEIAYDWYPDKDLLIWDGDYTNILGYKKYEMGNDTDSWTNRIHPADLDHVLREVEIATSENRPFDLEYRFRHKNGSYRWMHDRGTIFRNKAGKLEHMIGVFRDITIRKEQEEKIAKLSRIYAVLSGINSAIVRIHDRQTLFEEACRLAIKQGEFGLAWIGLVDSDTMKVTPAAWQGTKPEATESFALMPRTASENIPEGRGTVGNSIRSGQVRVCNELTAEIPVGAARAKAVELGYRSVISLPMMVDDRVVAVMTIYADEPQFFDEEEIRLLTELSGDISFALQYIDKMEQANFLAYYDHITGLANRTLLHERLAQSIQDAGNAHQRLAVLTINLDRFRHINDTMGRQIGDVLIRQVANRLVDSIPKSAYAAHIGGDQFAIVMVYRRVDEVMMYINNQLDTVLGAPFNVNNIELRIAAKVGISFYPDDSSDAEILLLNSESALKSAKSLGEHYLFFDPDMTAVVSEKLALENELRRALEHEEFVLYYQPRVNLETGQISGLEALIRWMHPERNLISPMQFIPLLEETGLILDVGRWAFDQAASDYKIWQSRGLNPPRIAVNVSAIQIRHKDFVKLVENVVYQNNMTESLDLEITESVIMENLEKHLGKLYAINKAGLNILIDDFGTGYSSLRYLTQLPVSELKVDRSFVIDMVSNQHNQLIVLTIITLAHGLNLKVVAEGVETEQQADLLKRLDCDEAQGYYYSKPVPPKEIELMLHRAG